MALSSSSARSRGSSHAHARIGQLAAGVAHEINNPAFAIMGLSDSLKVKITQDLKERFNEKELKYFQKSI